MKSSTAASAALVWSLIFALVFGIQSREANADVRPVNPDEGPDTFELIPYGDSEYRFTIIPLGADPPSDFEKSSFDDSEFDTGRAAFGSRGSCPLSPTVKSRWPPKSQLLIRRNFSVESGATNLRVMVSVDNDILGVFFNGTRIADQISHDFCPDPDEFRFDVPQALVVEGNNLLAFHVLDRGSESFFDTRVLADVMDQPIPEIIGTPGQVTVVLSDKGDNLAFEITAMERPLRSALVTLAVNGGAPVAQMELSQIKTHMIMTFVAADVVPPGLGDRLIYGGCDPFGKKVPGFPDGTPPLRFPCPISCPTFPVPGGPCDISPSQPQSDLFVNFISGDSFSLSFLTKESQSLADFYDGVGVLLRNQFAPVTKSLERFAALNNAVFQRPLLTREFESAVAASGLRKPLNQADTNKVERWCNTANAACGVTALSGANPVSGFTCGFALGWNLGCALFCE